MREGQLVLETVAGSCPLPTDCFAALRLDDSASAGSLLRCKGSEANSFKDIPVNGSVAKVDLFKYVGSISLGLREPGVFTEASVQWPGLQDGEVLTLRLTLSSGAGEEPLAPPPAVRRPTPEPEVVPASPATKPISTPAVDGSARPQLTQLPPPSTPSQPDVSPPSMKRTSSRSPAAPRREDRERDAAYRPIVLNNCNQIIPFLYLGGVDAATDTQALANQGIRAVCCCVRELEFPTKEFHQDLEYYRVDVEDISREPIELFFDEATEFIHSHVSREQPVLVHCRAGVSRSASVVIAYLIAYGGYSLHDAFFLARSHRPIVTPNIGFMEKLGEFEESKRGTEPTIDINKYVGWYSMPERPAVPDLRPD